MSQCSLKNSHSISLSGQATMAFSASASAAMLQEAQQACFNSSKMVGLWWVYGGLMVGLMVQKIYRLTLIIFGFNKSTY